jgi:hypothetical protein
MAVHAIALLNAAKTTHELFAMIDGGDFASSLGDIEMSAARSAFEAVPRAADKRGQVWECIGHLSSAQHAYEQFILSRPLGNVTATRSHRNDDANAKRRFMLIMKAVCYKYLGEQTLCEDTLRLSTETVEKNFSGFEWGLWSIQILLFVPLVADILYIELKEIGKADKEYDTDFDRLSKLLTKSA